MRVLRLLLIATLTCGSLLLVAPGAGAASRNCAALTSLNSKLSSLDTSGKDLGQFKTVATEFKSAAKKSKGKLKSALNNLGGLYSSIGGGDISDLSKLSTSSYSKSLKTFIKATVGCS